MKRFCHKSKADHHRPLIRCLLYRKVPQVHPTKYVHVHLHHARACVCACACVHARLCSLCSMCSMCSMCACACAYVQATELQNFSLTGGACRLITSSSDEVASPSYHSYP